MTWLAVGLGGALGSIARHGMNVAVGRVFGQPVPYATAAVNVIGCVVIGILAGSIAAGNLRLTDTWRVFVFVGILGGFTTFSSFGLDTLILVRSGATGLAIANVVGQVALGLGGLFAGYWLIDGFR